MISLIDLISRMVSISGDGAPDGAPGRLTRESTFRLSAERTHRRDGYSVVRPAATGTGVTEIRGRKPTALAVGGIRQFIPQTTSGDILPVVNDGLPRTRNPGLSPSRFQDPLPRSVGRVSSLARERPVALSRALPSASESSTPGFSGALSKRSCLTARSVRSHFPDP